MKRRPGEISPFLILVFFFFLITPVRGQAQDGDSSWWPKPLSSRNQFPILHLFLGFEPESATSLKPGRTSLNFDLSLSNIIKISSAGFELDADRLVLDFEWWRFLAQFEVGLGGGFQAGLSLPVFYRSGGFLDSFISGFHETFGIPNSVRRSTPNGLFRYELFLDGGRVLGPIQRGMAIGDAVLSLKKIWSFSGTGFGLRAALKVPTGPWREAAGSGASDLGFGLILGGAGRTLGYTLNANYCLLGRPMIPGLRARDYFSLMAGLHLRLGRRLALNAQADYFSRFVDSRIPILNQRAGQIALGLRWRAAERLMFEFRLSEDLASTSPDFTFGLRLEFSKGDTIPCP